MIEQNYFWTNVFLLSVGTLLIRGSIIAISSKVKISDRWREIFSYIPAAILPAFIAPAVFFHQGHADWLYGKERVLILILATIVCYVSKSTMATIACGLIALYFI